MRQRTLVLTREQRAELDQTRDRDQRAYPREMAAAQLKIADGQTACAVARHGLHKPRTPETIYCWLSKYAAQGLAGLVHRLRGHRGFCPRQGDELWEIPRQPPALFGLARPRCRLTDLRQAPAWLHDYSLPGISQALTRLGGPPDPRTPGAAQPR